MAKHVLSKADDVVVSNCVNHFFADVITEVAKARAKFPVPNPLFAALGEEFGEVAKALIDPGETERDLYMECVQTAAMACRLAVEGDPAYVKSVRLAKEIFKDGLARLS